MVTIRLSRGGAKKRPFYHIIVADGRSKRDGRHIERLGYFNPLATANEVGFSINNERYAYEKALYNSSSNDDLTKLLNIQKSLIYFVTNLRFNDLLLLKIQRSNFLRIKDEEKLDILQDIIIENQQALSMSELYSDILNGTMDAFASIISNNLNEIMKRLTSVTIVLAIPTLIASFYGMNVELPYEHHPYSFVIVFSISIVTSSAITWFFVRKKWF